MMRGPTQKLGGIEMKNRWRNLALTVLLVGSTSLSVPVSAVSVAQGETQEISTPWYLSMTGVVAKIEQISNNIIVCNGEVRILSQYEGSLTMILEKYSNGRWEQVNSWVAEGSGKLGLHKQAYVNAGVDYRLVVEIVVNDANGNEVETATKSYEYSY